MTFFKNCPYKIRKTHFEKRDSKIVSYSPCVQYGLFFSVFVSRQSIAPRRRFPIYYKGHYEITQQSSSKVSTIKSNKMKTCEIKCS